MTELYQRIKQLREQLGLSQQELADQTGYTSKTSIAKIEAGKVDLPQSKILAFAKALRVSPAYLMGWEKDLAPLEAHSDHVCINIYGSVPAGIPIEAIEDIIGTEEIPSHWLRGGKTFFGLQVRGDSMYPKYMDGDTIIVSKQSNCENGQDCVVYVDDYDTTLKRVLFLDGGAIQLKPLNPSYPPRTFYPGDPIQIAGVVVEIRRRV